VSSAAFEVSEARVLATRGERRKALEALDRLLGTHPDAVPALLLRGTLLLDEREPEPALRDLERAAGLAPASAEALNGLARGLLAAERPEQARGLAERARALLGEGENYIHAGPVYLTLVWCLREQRRYREALSMLEEGLRRSDDALLAEWVVTLEEELAEAEQERC
jgi:tetratricopeptide (TPR) repeat protein